MRTQETILVKRTWPSWTHSSEKVYTCKNCGSFMTDKRAPKEFFFVKCECGKRLVEDYVVTENCNYKVVEKRGL